MKPQVKFQSVNYQLYAKFYAILVHVDSTGIEWIYAVITTLFYGVIVLKQKIVKKKKFNETQ